MDIVMLSLAIVLGPVIVYIATVVSVVTIGLDWAPGDNELVLYEYIVLLEIYYIAILVYMLRKSTVRK